MKSQSRETEMMKMTMMMIVVVNGSSPLFSHP